MLWYVPLLPFGFFADLLTAPRRADHDKDLQIRLLQHQLRLLQRERPRPAHLTRREEPTLAALAARLVGLGAGPRRRLDEVLLLVQPDTVLQWQRELARRTWISRRTDAGGRRPIAGDLQALTLRLARENPRLGDRRILGDLATLGHGLGRSTIRDVLKRRHVAPAPGRQQRGGRWRTFRRRRRDGGLAGDVVAVERLLLKTIYALFVIGLGTRRVQLAVGAAAPPAAWVTRQARRVSWKVQDGELAARSLIRDQEGQCPSAFDAVVRSEGVAIVRTPHRAPTANAVAERWVGLVRRGCVDHRLIIGAAHLRRVLAAHVADDNRARPHQGLDQQLPMPADRRAARGPVRRRDALGGPLRDDYCAAG